MAALRAGSLRMESGIWLFTKRFGVGFGLVLVVVVVVVVLGS